MDAGDRWMLMDAAGKPMLAWDLNDKGAGSATQQRFYRTDYDALHRPTAQWLTIDEADPTLVEAFQYCDTDQPNGAVNLADAKKRNLIGQAIKHWDPSGLATVERIDLSGQPAHITRTLIKPTADNNLNGVLDWNLTNRQSLLEDETFIQLTEYDAFGRMTTLYNWHRDITFTSDGTQQNIPGSTNRVAVYVPEYNERGVLKSEWLHVRASKFTAPDGRLRFTADPARSKQAITNISYNEKGQKLSLALGNGTITTYAYDDNTFRLTSLSTVRATSPRSMQNLSYTYDPVGNITHIQDDSQQTIWFANQQVEPSNDYIYDAVYRLIEATGRENAAAVGAPLHAEGNWPTGSFPSASSTRNYTQRYRYDSVSNFTTVQHIASNFPGQPDGSWTREYAYAFDDPAQPASNRVWQTWQGGNRTTQAVTYRYDRHGSMLNLANTAPGQNIRWDWRDMIRALDLQGGGDVFYNYGIDKQRTRKRIERNGSGSEDRVYLRGYELYRRRNPQGEVIEEIESLHLFEGEQRVLLVDDMLVAALQPGPKGMTVKQQTLFRYQYGNHLGSVSLELDKTAQVISYEEFHPYGTSGYRLMSFAVEAPAKRYRYTGMERDEESGLCYHGVRYYLPWLGRWTSADPAGVADGSNLYPYVNNNPILLSDPSGRQGDAQDLMNGVMWHQMGQGFGAMIESGIGGRAYVEPATNVVQYTPPQNGVGGVTGGIVLAATLRAVPIEDRPSLPSLIGLEMGAGLVPVLDPATRLVMGTTVTGRDVGDLRSRSWAAVQVALDVLPLVLEARAASIEARMLTTGLQETQTSVSLAVKPGSPIGHNMIGIDTGGGKVWSDLRVNNAERILNDKIIVGGEAVVAPRSAPDPTKYIIIEVPRTPAEATRAAAVAQEQIDIGNVGSYELAQLDCTTYAADVMQAAGIGTPWVSTPWLNAASAALHTPAAIGPFRTLAIGAAEASTTLRATEVEERLQMSIPDEHPNIH